MKKPVNTMRRAFTLVEIMIVVLIIGILLNIAAPSILRAREGARARACQRNLKAINGATEQWAMENKKATGATLAISNLVGATLYLKATPACPNSGTYSSTLSVGSNPTCSIGTFGNAQAYDDHTLP